MLNSILNTCNIAVSQLKQQPVHHVNGTISISKGHSFLWNILPNSAGKFAKFHSLLQEKHQNSAPQCGILFLSILSHLLLDY